MGTIRYILLTLICLVSVGAGYPPTPNKNGEERLDKAALKVQRQTGGRVLLVEKRKVDGKLIYRIKVLTLNGRVQNFNIDPLE